MRLSVSVDWLYPARCCCQRASSPPHSACCAAWRMERGSERGGGGIPAAGSVSPMPHRAAPLPSRPSSSIGDVAMVRVVFSSSL